MISFRDASSDDYPLFVTCFSQLGVDDAVPTPERFASRIAPHTLFLEEDGVPRAYSFTTPIDHATAHVRHLVVLDGARNRGLGRALLLEVARRLRASGLSHWRLNVKEDNAPALALYTRVGMSTLMKSSALWLPWERVANLPPPRPSLSLQTPAPETLPAIETTLGILPGTCQSARVPGDHLLVALEGPTPVGLARFDPGFPGCYPFRAAEARVARTLLEALHPHRNPTDDRLGLVCEGQPELSDALEQAGAIVRFRMLLLGGPLP